jgi:hypothetical protein
VEFLFFLLFNYLSFKIALQDNKGNEDVRVSMKVGGKEFPIGTLSVDKYPQCKTRGKEPSKEQYKSQQTDLTHYLFFLEKRKRTAPHYIKEIKRSKKTRYNKNLDFLTEV